MLQGVENAPRVGIGEIAAVELAEILPELPDQASSVWGWVGATTAIVASAYWVAYRYWNRQTIAVRKAVFRFW